MSESQHVEEKVIPILCLEDLQAELKKRYEKKHLFVLEVLSVSLLLSLLGPF